MFGSSTNTSFGTSTGFGTVTSLLGASETESKGTPVKFIVVHESDSMVKNGITTNISVRHQFITSMSNYEKKSIEELRIEDYEAGRKKVCSGSLFGSSSDSGFSTSSSLTGLQPTTGFGAAGEAGFTFGNPALATNAVASGGISLASLTSNSISSPFTEGLTPGQTSAIIETSNIGFTFAGGSTQPTVGVFKFGSAPLQELTANTTSSPFPEELTPGKTSAFPGTSNIGFTFAGGSTQPAAGVFKFGSAPLQESTENATSSPFTEGLIPGKTSASTGTSNVGFTFAEGTTQPAAGVFKFGSATLQESTENATSSPFTEGLTPGKTSASTGTSNVGFTFAGGSTQPAVGVFKFGSAPLQESTANATSSPFTEGNTPGKTSASTGTSNVKFTFAGGSTQPTVGVFKFGSAPLQESTANATSSPFTEGNTPGKTSASTGTSNVKFTFAGGSTQPTVGVFKFGSAPLQESTANASSSPPSEGLTPDKTSASTGTSNIGFTFAGGSTQPTVGVFKFGSASLQESTANATSSPFTEGLTPGKTSASSGTSNTGFEFGGSSAQPTVGGFNFGSTPLQGFTFEAGKTTAPAMVNPTPAFTPGGATNLSSVLTLGATPVTTTTSSAFCGGVLKLGGTTATPASTGFTTPGVPVVVSSSATPVTVSFSGLATTAAATATATNSTASTGLTLGSTGASAVPGFSFAAASGFKIGAAQTTTSLSTATKTGSLFGSSSKKAGLRGQKQKTKGLGHKPGVLFSTASSTPVTEIKCGSKTSSTCGLADDPPSLSPRFSLSEAMSEGMEELRKENESLRKVIKMYKENEEAMEELRRFYTDQAIKHKENMEQAVSHKFLELVSKVKDLKTIRDTTPENGKTSAVIRDAIDLTRKNKIDLESLKPLQQVQECVNALQQAQECLRQCKDKEELLAADIVAQRDKARKDLFDSIDLFFQEVDLIPLQERENSLQHALNQLQEQEDALNSCRTDPDLEIAVEAYEEWMRNRQEITDVKQRVNQCTEDLTTALSRVELALKVSQDSSETGSMHTSFGDLDTMISSLSSAIQEEMDKSQVSEDKEAKQKVECAIKALITELKREMADIQELRDNLVPKCKSLQTDMSPWLEAKPDLKNVEDVRATIESLSLRLRERLADKKDLEEVESDISDIYLQLHKSFEDESNFMAELAKFASEHFPELPIAHPEVGISEFLASNGLVKPGRELEHYPHYDSVPSISHDKSSVIKTEFAGRPCILKELNVDRELGNIETLQRNAVEYHSLDCPFLMPLDAFFVTGSRAFVQMPLLISGEEWLTSHECSSEAITLVLRDILDALNSLHLKNICHGSVHLESVFVEKRSGVYRGVLDFFPFTNSQCSQTEDMKLFGDLIVKMNFPNKDTTTTISHLTEDTDLLAVLGDLLDTDDVDRLTAQQTLQQAYFCKCV